MRPMQGTGLGDNVALGDALGPSSASQPPSYPGTDIEGLTLAAAAELYRRDYWDRIRGDELPPPLALLVFDAAVNNGVGRAVRWLQQAAGVTPDGLIGMATLEAVSAHAGGGAGLLSEFQAQRLMFMAGLPTWRTFGLGWARRLCSLPYQAVRMGGA